MKKVFLVVPSIKDLKYRQMWMKDPKTMSYNAGFDLSLKGYDKETGTITKTDKEMLAWFDNWINKEPDRYYAYIYSVDEDEPIGEVYYYLDGDTYSMGIVIHNKYRGKGYSYYALLELEKVAFEQNNIKENNNNQNNLFKQKISNNSINNTLNLYPNNLLGINTSQHFNDYNPIRFNNIPNLGLNDINTSSQISLLSFKNPLLVDVNNFFNNPFKNEENYKQLLNSSSEEFFKSCLINSSKNFFPYMGNYISGNNNNPENENNNNINYPFINPLVFGNSFLQNINITSPNNNNNINQGKNANENINKSKN